MTYAEVKGYADEKWRALRTDNFKDVVEAEFFDAEMKIRWAFFEKKEDFVIVFAEHYPPIIQHEDETVNVRQLDFDGNEVKSWNNEGRESSNIGA